MSVKKEMNFDKNITQRMQQIIRSYEAQTNMGEEYPGVKHLEP